MATPFSNKSPWSMKWVLVAILLGIVPYTWLTLRYRKPEPAYEPYEDARTRANVMRLLDAGFRRISVRAEILAGSAPSQPAGPVAEVAEVPGGLPVSLSHTLVDIPQMPDRVLSVAAPAGIMAGAPYVVTFTCSVPDTHEQPAGAEVYLRGRQLTIVPTFETLPGELLARSNRSEVRIEIPPDVLQTGQHEATLIGARNSLRWTFDVK